MISKLSSERVFQGVFRLFVFTIPIYPSISVKLLVACFLLSFFKFKHELEVRTYIQRSWDVYLYFFVLFLGILYSDNKDVGLKVLETAAGLLIMTFIFFRLKEIIQIGFKLVFHPFLAGLAIASLICLINALYVYTKTGSYQSLFFRDLTGIINSHPTYFAYFIIAAVGYCLFYLSQSTKFDRRFIVVVLLTFFLFAMLMLTGGRTAYVSMLLVLSYFILKFILEWRYEKIILTNLMVTIVLLIGLFGMSSIDHFDFAIASKNDYWERSVLWHSAIKANPNPLIGVGTGDYKTVLNDYYLTHNLDEFAKDSYNSHNQFIQFYFSNGIIGLIILLIMIARPLYLSVRSQNALGILLMFPFVIYGITEVFLGRYQGVVFFALLHQIVIYQYYSSKSQFSLKAV